MSNKIINYVAVTAIFVFGLYFLILLGSSESSSSSLYCLCLPLFGLAVLGAFWLIWQAIRPKKQVTPPAPAKKAQPPKRPATSTPQRTPATSTDRFVQVSSGTKTSTPRVSISYSFETGSSRFIKDAQKYHTVEGKPAEPVAFMQYWPTFESFNAQQKKWYFYWRSEVRQGRYPQTDLSYIFVYIYELLCLVEISDPAKAAAQIKTIWRAYRPVYPKLDNYLPDWGGDLLAAKVGIVKSVAWWWELMTKDKVSPPAAVINILIQKAVDAGRSTDLPYAIWSGLNLYHPQNKFYERFNKDGAVDRGYLRAIKAVDDYYMSLKGQKGLIERYTPPKPRPQTKSAFASAIVPDSYPKVVDYGEARNFAGSSRLGNLLLAITKYAENILRKQNRFSARLSGFELEEKLKQVIDAALATQPPEKKAEEPIRITLDTERIAVLQQESEQVVDLLEPESNEPTKPLYSDIVQVRALWEKLDLPARRLLMAIYEHKVNEVSQITLEVVGADISPFVLLDRINNPSLPLLGDRIVSVENRKQVKIADDFVDEMELIAKDHSFEALVATPAESAQVEAEDPWQRFLQQLTPEESGLLAQIAAAGSLTKRTLRHMRVCMARWAIC